MKFIYIICPVRGATANEKAYLDNYIAMLEKDAGYTVHYPPRDVEQSLPGPVICEKHRDAICRADEIHVYWNPESKGSHFDLGMAYVLQLLFNKTVRIINDVHATPNGKSYADVLLKMAVPVS